jgi:hypothetical protein
MTERDDVEPAELHRVYPPVADAAAGTDATPRNRGCSGPRNGASAHRPGRRAAGGTQGHARRPAPGPRCVARPSATARTTIAAVVALVVAMAALDWVTKGNPVGEGGGECRSPKRQASCAKTG